MKTANYLLSIGVLTLLGLSQASAREVGDMIFHDGSNGDITGLNRGEHRAWGQSENYKLEGHPGHAMIYVGTDENGVHWVVEAPGAGQSVNMAPLSNYPSHHDVFRRMTKNIDLETRKNLSLRALDQIGKEYAAPDDITEYLLYGVPSIQQQKGQSFYKFGTRFTCVGLVEYCYEKEVDGIAPDGDGRNLVKSDPRWFGPDLFEEWRDMEGSYVKADLGLEQQNKLVRFLANGEGWIYFPYSAVYEQLNKLTETSSEIMDSLRLERSVGVGPEISEVTPSPGQGFSDESEIVLSCVASDEYSGVFSVTISVSGPDDYTNEVVLYTLNEGNPEAAKTVNLNGKETKVFWYLDNETPTHLTNYSSVLNSSILSQGRYDVKIIARDRAGNEKVSATNFVISPPLDLMFVIDTTGSMADDIAEVKANVRNIIDQTKASSPDSRFGVIEYRDGDADAFAARTVISLTDDTDAIVSAVNGMGATGGGDTPEFMLSGISHALDGNAGNWRCNPVKKAIIVMADAPGKDPEPGTNYTKSGVANRMNTGDFANDCPAPAPMLLAEDVFAMAAVDTTATTVGEIDLFGILIGSNSAASSDLNTLSTATGGIVVNAANASEVVDAIIEVIGVIGGGNLMTVKSSGEIALNAQTGLYEQKVVFENLSASEVSGFRVYVENLPDGVTLRNAHGEEGGRSYIDYRDLVAVDGEVSFTLEYYSAARTAFDTPTFSVVAVGDPFTGPDDSLTASLNPRVILGEGKDVLLEFESRSGKEYLIQYSFDLGTWKTVPSVIAGTGSKVQWLDNGPPKTECHPSTCSTRYYRLIERETVK